MKDDFLILIGVVLIVVLPILAILAFVFSLVLMKRVAALEAQLRQMGPDFQPLHRRPAPASPPPDQPKPAGDAALIAATVLSPSLLKEGAAAGPQDRAPRPRPPPRPPSPAATAKRAERSFEEQLGTRWAVWVGGLALALGGVFLVRYSIEAGLLGPQARITLGLLFAIALLTAGEYLRRRVGSREASLKQLVDIPSIVTGAGIISLFATVFAAYYLHDFISPGLALILLGLVGIGAMALASLHGQWLAALGLIGAYIAPYLVHTGSKNFWSLAIYLTAVTASCYGLARLRLWRWLAICASVAACGWGLIFALEGDETPANAYFLALAALTLAILIIEPHRKQAYARFDYLGTAVLAAIAYLAFTSAWENFLYTPGVGYAVSIPSVVTALAIAAALLAVALAFDAMALAAIPAALLVLAIALVWPHTLSITIESSSGTEQTFFAHPLQQREVYITMMAVAGALLFAGPTLRLFRRQAAGLAPAVALAASSVAGSLVLLALSYAHLTEFKTSLHFGLLALAACLLLAWIAHLFMMRERGAHGPQHHAVASIHAAGATGALALALTAMLADSGLTFAFALAALGTAWVASQRPLGALRYGAAALALLVVLRVGGPRTIFGEYQQIFPDWSEILQRHVVPALAIGYAGALLRRRITDGAAAILDAAALFLGMIGTGLAIRLLVFGQAAASYADWNLTEAGLDVGAALAASILLAWVAPKTTSAVYPRAAPFATFLTLLLIFVGPITVVNPLFESEAIAGGLVFNALLLAYLLPAALCVLLAWIWQALPPRAPGWGNSLPLATGAMAVVLGFLYLMLETHVLVLGNESFTYFVHEKESYAISAVWLVYGLALLAGGVIWRHQGARLASALVILIVILKVFLFDMQNLEGVWRALSFIGLGITLIGIGLVYQHVLFRWRRAEIASPDQVGGAA